MNHLHRRQALLTGICALSHWSTGFCASASPNNTSDGPAGQPPVDSTPHAFKTSLSEGSLANSIREGAIDHLDFSRLARERFQIDAVDYVSSLFRDELRQEAYLSKMNKRAADHGVRQILLVADDEGDLGHASAPQRQRARQQHQVVIDAAQTLGCRGVCVQVSGVGKPEEVAKRAAESLQALAEYSQAKKLMVLATNCSGYAKNPDWLASLLKSVGAKNCGAFPYFHGMNDHRRSPAMAQLLKLSQGVCATAKAFDEHGNESEIDYPKMLEIIGEAGYRGYISLEYRGSRESEHQGIESIQRLVAKHATAIKA